VFDGLAHEKEKQLIAGLHVLTAVLMEPPSIILDITPCSPLKVN
jgi:hypothetical protein